MPSGLQSLSILHSANFVTSVRALLVAFVAASLFAPASPESSWRIVIAAGAATALDGVDGWLARRSGNASAFGARFDMETDAAMILVLSMTAYTTGKAGVWVLASGLLRYLFLAAAAALPWMNAPLPPSVRRQTVCVVQIVGLIIAVSPVAAPPVSDLVAGVALAALVYSFSVDTLWLSRRTA